MNELMTLPKCHKCGCTMMMRSATNQTQEQQYCGTWYDCPSPGCACSVLMPSAELLAFYAEAAVERKEENT